jgi:anti-sigma B factor antagonist
MPEPAIVITERNGAIVVTATVATLDETTAQTLLEQAQAAAEKSPSLSLILDLAGVETMPSMAIGALVTLWRKLQGSHQRLLLAGTQGAVRNTLTLCRLDKLFEFCDSEAAALTKLQAGAQ